MKLKYYINLNKGITVFVILALIAVYNQWHRPDVWVYLALHGTYGILWVFKSQIFPDLTWEHKVSVWYGVMSWFALALYWLPGWLLVSNNNQTPTWLLGVCISIYVFGVFFHFTSDMQKNVMLEEHPGDLITNKMMALSRNINYFGEFLIYISFALMPQNWFAFLPLLLFITFYWSFKIMKKEKSLALKKGFEEYKKRTKRFFPYLF